MLNSIIYCYIIETVRSSIGRNMDGMDDMRIDYPLIIPDGDNGDIGDIK